MGQNALESLGERLPSYHCSYDGLVLLQDVAKGLITCRLY